MQYRHTSSYPYPKNKSNLQGKLRLLSKISGTVLVSSALFVPHLALGEIPVTESKKGIAPIDDQWVSYKPKTQQPDLSALTEDELKDPKKLLAFLRDRPEALDPTQMTPFIAIEVGQTLLYGGEVRKAITLLDKAREKWPSQVQLLQTWARALVKMGAPSYARIGIEQWRAENPDQVVETYTQYLYALCIYLEGPEDPSHLSRSVELINTLLQDDPQYLGPDGISAAQLRSFADELRGRLIPRP